MSSATRLLVQTALRRIIRRSISGLAARFSAAIQPLASTTAPTSKPTTFPDAQPQSGASLSATSSATSQADRNTAGSQLIRVDVRFGDSGTNKATATPPATIMISGIQNSQ